MEDPLRRCVAITVGALSRWNENSDFGAGTLNVYFETLETDGTL